MQNGLAADIPNNKQCTSLHVAARYGQLKVCQMLMNAGSIGLRSTV